MTTINTNISLSMDVINNILSYSSISVQAKITKELYNKIAPIAITKIIKSIRYHRNRMNMIMEQELPMSNNLIRAHYILHYPIEFRNQYCIRAISRMEANGIFISTSDNNQLIKKKLFKNIIMLMSYNDIYSIGW